MILVGNQRGGARDLALHLLKDENEHVEVYEVRGFASQSLMGALNEAYAVSRGTRCKQFLFSLSLNPPASEKVKTSDFKTAIERIEKQLGLKDQPRAIVFHEKNGRRHAHAVWSRIRIDEMKAVHLSYTHNKLKELSLELYLEHGWKMPKGLVNSEMRDPRNFSLAEWQQAKRIGKDPRAIKTTFQDAWAISDSKAAFTHALEERGYVLARGDRRGFVAIDVHGEIYSIPKWTGVKTKDVRMRLGNEETLQSVAEAKEKIAGDMIPVAARFKEELRKQILGRNAALKDRHQALTQQHRDKRQNLITEINRRRIEESQIRQARFRTGLHGIWDYLRGENRRIKKQNEEEAQAALMRDRDELDALIFMQLQERRQFVDLRAEIAREFARRRQDLKKDMLALEQLGKHDPPEKRRRRGRRLER